MKSIIISIIAVFILGIITAGLTFKPDNTVQIILQSTDSRISSSDLARSAEIISARLKSFSNEQAEVSASSGRNQIIVKLNGNQDMNLVERLLTQKGTFGFYETFDYNEVNELLTDKGYLFSLLQHEVPTGSSVKIGCTTASGAVRVDEYMISLDLGRKCRFAWSNLFDDSEVCLYALKTSDGQGAIISGADIGDFGSGRDSASQEDYITFSFKKSSVQLWADITRRNTGKAVAIVLDGKVILAPVVQDEIANGKCTLTGGFTTAKVRFIAAMGANGELPVSFKVVK